MCAAVAGMGRARAVKSIRTRHTHAPTRAHQRSWTVGGGCDRTKDKRARGDRPPALPAEQSHGRQHGRVRRPSAQLFQVHLRHTHTLERPPPPTHLTAPRSTARCTGVRWRCTRLETKLPRHRVAETDFYRPSRVLSAAASYARDAAQRQQQ